MGVLNLVHELLHSFGASHDPRHCTPANIRTEGRYLMSKYSSSGVKKNNEVISNCTAASVASTLSKEVNMDIIHKLSYLKLKMFSKCLTVLFLGLIKVSVEMELLGLVKIVTVDPWRNVLTESLTVSLPECGGERLSARCGD